MKRSLDNDEAHDGSRFPSSPSPPDDEARPAKRTRTTGSGDRLSRLSDELLVRILGYLTLPGLLAVAPVSRRFFRLAGDSQLWKALYYTRFVLPRALRVRGVRGSRGPGRGPETPERPERPQKPQRPQRSIRDPAGRLLARPQEKEKPTDWKGQYKLRHNWDRGQCAVEELKLGGRSSGESRTIGVDDDDDDDDKERPRMLVKVVDGIAVTADSRRGLQVWELRTRSLLVAASLGEKERKENEEKREDEGLNVSSDQTTAPPASTTPVSPASPTTATTATPTPTALSVDASPGGLDIAIGRLDGGFDIWRLDLAARSLRRRFAHAASSSGPLVAIAYAHPLVLTATEAVLVSLYGWPASPRTATATSTDTATATSTATPLLPPPSLLTSLRSHSSRPPLALSIRRLPAVTIASIAYTFSTRQGWAIGIQDLHVQTTDDNNSSSSSSLPSVVTTRLAFSAPVAVGLRPSRPGLSSPSRLSPPSPSSVSASASASASSMPSLSSLPSPPAHPLNSPTASPHRPSPPSEDGPTSLSYTHPYLLATLPDNTLVLHLCTSSASSLAVSPGIRLWGHTSGISDAEITARGKAVSVSVRGDEMRVWELEGRPAAERGRSVAIRPPAAALSYSYDWHDRRNWVGFDDEMVIVLKESRGGRESLMVYDFT